jgi:RNA-directed DNA polymerase
MLPTSLFSDNRAKLRQWHERIIERLVRYRLTLHSTQPRPVGKGISFLGFRVFPGRRRLKRRKGIHFQRKLQQNLLAYAGGEITFDQLTATVQGWVNHVRYGNTVGLRKALLKRRLIPAVRKVEPKAL